MALNVALVTAVFVGAAFISRHPPDWLRELRLGTETIKAVLWLTAIIFSLPLLIATFRKLQAFGMLISETRVTRANAGERTAAIRAVIAQSVLIAGVVLLILYVLVLSSTLLPSLKILLVLLVIVALVTVLLWRSLIKIYSHAQIALRETLSQPPPPRPAQAPAQLPGFLREADLETMTIAADAPAVGKLIRELELRTRTGASIVGIERNGGERIINPGPDEELQRGDQVLLLGTRAQLDSAKSFFLKPA
jgi:CPA2 family monovalent cation:H+ antiporter-2